MDHLVITRWETIGDEDLIVGDKEAVATFYEVSIRTVERHCTPLYHQAKEGLPRGESGAAIYDLLAAEASLAGVAPRAKQSALHLRIRMERHYLT